MSQLSQKAGNYRIHMKGYFSLGSATIEAIERGTRPFFSRLTE